MDFVISKVGLSVCALLMVSVLGQTLFDSPSASERAALEDIVNGLDRLLYDCVRGGDEVDCLYQVPSLPGNSAISVTFLAGGVVVRSGAAHASSDTCCPLNLWEWSGEEINRTDVDELSRDHEALEAVSGDLLAIMVRAVPVQGMTVSMVFVNLVA